jgi:hypothetical protein
MQSAFCLPAAERKKKHGRRCDKNDDEVDPVAATGSPLVSLQSCSRLRTTLTDVAVVSLPTMSARGPCVRNGRMDDW